MVYAPKLVSSFPSFSFSTFPFSPSPPFDWGAVFGGAVFFSFNTSACLSFAVDDLVTLRSLDIGVGRTETFVALVRVTPLGRAFTMVERNPEAFMTFAAGSLDGPETCSTTLPFTFSSGSAVSGAGGGAGVGTTTSAVVGGIMEVAVSDGSEFLGGCESGIVGATDGIGSGSGTGPFEMLEVEGTSGYGSAGIGGSTETDLDRETRWEGGVGDLEGNRNDNGFGCGGIRCEDRLVGEGLGSGLDSNGGSSCGWGCGGGAGRSMSMRFLVAVSSRRRGGGVDNDRSDEPRGVRGDIDPSIDRGPCTGVLESASGSRLNGSSFCEPEVVAITKAGRG